MRRPFKMLTTRKILAHVRPGDWFITLDLKDAYFQIQIIPRHRPFLRFAFDGQVYQYTVLPFGLSLAPRTFTKCMDTALAPLRSQGMRILNYLDDWLILAQSEKELISHRTVLLSHLESLGLTVNWTKSSLLPSQSTSFLGIELDSVALTSISRAVFRITDVIISGPLNSIKCKTNTGDYVINWTPTAENCGQHFPFCFIAEGQNGSDIYHSEMRCVVAKVDSEGPVAHVTCTQNSMSVTIEKSSIERLHGGHLRLIDPSCQVYSNGTHVFANTLLNECGTQFEENNNELIFKNKISTFDDPRNLITRKNQLEIEILCKYQKRTNLTMEFDTHRPPLIFSEKGFGTFHYEFEFYASGNFHNRRDTKSYPLEYSVGDKIYMQIEPVTPVQNTEVFLESCVATPYDNHNYPISYPIITNGCNIDETVQIFSSHKSYVQFAMEAFKFIGLHDQVYISCSIIICEANNPNTRCSQGCTNSTTASPSHHHHKREAPIQTDSHLISQGPLRLKRSSASQVTMSQGLNLNIVLVVSCLLAAVAMVCGLIAYRSRGESIRYQPVSSHEF